MKAAYDSFLAKFLGTKNAKEQANIFWYTSGGLFVAAAYALFLDPTIVQGYLVDLKITPEQLGLLGLSTQIAGAAGLFTLMGLVDGFQQRAKAMCILSYILAIPPLALALTAFTQTNTISPILIYVIFVVFSCIFQYLNFGCAGIEYALLVRSFNTGIRGRVTGIQGVAQAFVTVVITTFAGYLLKKMGFPNSYAMCFLIGAVIMALRGPAYGRIKELPELTVPGESKSMNPFVALIEMFKLKEFRLLAGPHVLRGLVGGVAFFIVSTGKTVINIPPEYAAYVATAAAVAGIVGLIVVFLTVDKYGPGPVCLICDAVAAVGMAGLLFAPNPNVFLLLVFVFWVGLSIEANAVPLGTFEIVPAQRMAAFTAARLMIMMGSGALFTWVVGILLTRYPGAASLIFVVGGVLKLLNGIWFWMAFTPYRKKGLINQFGMGVWLLKVFGIRRKERLGATPVTIVLPPEHRKFPWAAALSGALNVGLAAVLVYIVFFRPPQVREVVKLIREELPTKLATRQPIQKASPANYYDLYVVKRGDSLWDIAKSKYGSGTYLKAIRALNQSDGDILPIGAKLKLPCSALARDLCGRNAKLSSR